MGLKPETFSGSFFAGEMMDWDAPTGGFLLQGCFSTGWCAGIGVSSYVKSLEKL